jgi:hypothetical protein
MALTRHPNNSSILPRGKVSMRVSNRPSQPAPTNPQAAVTPQTATGLQPQQRPAPTRKR